PRGRQSKLGGRGLGVDVAFAVAGVRSRRGSPGRDEVLAGDRMLPLEQITQGLRLNLTLKAERRRTAAPPPTGRLALAEVVGGRIMGDLAEVVVRVVQGREVD